MCYGKPREAPARPPCNFQLLATAQPNVVVISLWYAFTSCFLFSPATERLNQLPTRRRRHSRQKQPRYIWLSSATPSTLIPKL